MTIAKKSLITNLDGCLCDLSETYYRVIEKNLNAENLTMSTEKKIAIGIGLEQTLTLYGLNASSARLRKICEHIIDESIIELDKSFQADPAVFSQLEKLKLCKVRLVLNSAVPAKVVFHVLELLNCINYFEFIFAGEDLAVHPPDPGFYTNAFLALGESPRQTVIACGSNASLVAATKSGAHPVRIQQPHLLQQNLNELFHLNG